MKTLFVLFALTFTAALSSNAQPLSVQNNTTCTIYMIIREVLPFNSAIPPCTYKNQFVTVVPGSNTFPPCNPNSKIESVRIGYTNNSANPCFFFDMQHDCPPFCNTGLSFYYVDNSGCCSSNPIVYDWTLGGSCPVPPLTIN